MSNYVSCFKINGIPILPPILSAEEKLEMFDYKKKAIEVERKLKQRREINNVSSSERVVYDNSAISDDDSSTEVLKFIRQALKDSSDREEVRHLLNEVDEELKNKRIKKVKPVICNVHLVNRKDLIPSPQRVSLESFNSSDFAKSLDEYSVKEGRSPSLSPIQSGDNGEETLGHDLSKNWSEPGHMMDDIDFEPNRDLVSRSVGPHSVKSNEVRVPQPVETLLSPQPSIASEISTPRAKRSELMFSPIQHFSRLQLEKLDTPKDTLTPSPVEKLITPLEKRISQLEQLISSSTSLGISGMLQSPKSSTNDVNIQSLAEKQTGRMETQTFEEDRTLDDSRLQETLESHKDQSCSPYVVIPQSNISVKSQDGSEPYEEVTPKKLIRSNSYTLESPSPTVLLYLRNLAAGEPKVDQMSEMRKNVVKNLNNCWAGDGPLDVDFSQLDMTDTSVNSISEDHLLKSQEMINLVLQSPMSPESCNRAALEKKKQKAAATIQAGVRGYLVRRLMRTQRVVELKNTIKDAVLCAWSLYSEQAISPSDLSLHERIMRQVTAACYELHSIFIQWPTEAKMSLIKTDRERLRNPRPKLRRSADRRRSIETISIESSSKSASSMSGSKRTPGSDKKSSRARRFSNPTTMKFQPWNKT